MTDEDRIVYHIDGKPLASMTEAELEEWAARQRAARAMREAGSGKGRKKAAATAVVEEPRADAEDV